MKDIVRLTYDKSMGLITDFLDLYASIALSIDYTKNVGNAIELKGLLYNQYSNSWLLSSYEENI